MMPARLVRSVAGSLVAMLLGLLALPLETEGRLGTTQRSSRSLRAARTGLQRLESGEAIFHLEEPGPVASLQGDGTNTSVVQSTDGPVDWPEAEALERSAPVLWLDTAWTPAAVASAEVEALDPQSFPVRGRAPPAA